MSYLITYDRNSNIIRVRLLDSSSTTGAGLTGLTSSSAGLIISTIADVEAKATTYTQAGGTIETISTLGTYATPTATKCRFKEVDSTNFPGLYEIQLDDARFSVTSATDLIVSILGASNLAQTMIHIPLQRLDLQSASVTAGTVSDKTGYALTQNFPTNFADMSIAKTTGLVATAVTESTIADAVWDEILTGATHNIATSAGRRLRGITAQVIMTGTVLSATENTVNLDTGASAVNGAYDPALIVIEDGTGAGQCRNIFQYTGATRTCVVDRDWKTQPSTDSTYVILGDAGREHVNEGLARGGSTNTIILNANASAINNAYIGQIVFLRSGLGEDQARRVTAYDGTTKTATIFGNWDIIPDGTTAYAMLPTGRFTDMELQDSVWNNGSVRLLTDAVGNDIDVYDIQLVTDKLDDMTEIDDIAGPVWTANSMHNLPRVVWDDLVSNHAVTGSLGLAVSDIKTVTDELSRMVTYDDQAKAYTYLATALANAPVTDVSGIEAVTDKIDDMIVMDELNGPVWTYDALEYVSSLVWDRPAGYHLTDATMGKYMNDFKDTSVKLEGMMESIGDGGYRYTADALAEAPGADVSGIQAVTDKLDDMLESDGSGGYQYTTLSLENAPGGSSGLISRTYTVYALDQRTPVPNIQVWVTSDAAGLNRIDNIKTTNDLGQVTFHFNLDLGTHVWIWNRSSTVGDEEIL